MNYFKASLELREGTFPVSGGGLLLNLTLKPKTDIGNLRDKYKRALVNMSSTHPLYDKETKEKDASYDICEYFDGIEDLAEYCRDGNNLYPFQCYAYDYDRRYAYMRNLKGVMSQVREYYDTYEEAYGTGWDFSMLAETRTYSGPLQNGTGIRDEVNDRWEVVLHAGAEYYNNTVYVQIGVEDETV